MEAKVRISYFPELHKKHAVGLLFLLGTVRDVHDARQVSDMLWIGRSDSSLNTIERNARSACEDTGFEVVDLTAGKLNLLRDSHGVLRTLDLYHIKDSPLPHADLHRASEILYSQFPTIIDRKAFDDFYSPSPHAA
ncbi:MAG: hypothetical protein AAB343_02025 [Patescibacteria group bacterium]